MEGGDIFNSKQALDQAALPGTPACHKIARKKPKESIKERRLSGEGSGVRGSRTPNQRDRE